MRHEIRPLPEKTDMEVSITNNDRELYNIAIKKGIKDLTEEDKKILAKFAALEEYLEKLEKMSVGAMSFGDDDKEEDDL